MRVSLWAALAAMPSMVLAVPSPSLDGAAPIASPFDYHLGLRTAPIPISAAPDPKGAFRFICGAGQVSYDDPIVYYGQPGKSHLHQFYGNTSVNAYSSYASMRQRGGSTCNNSPFPLNRSGYWMPAMLDGQGNVVRPDYVSIYYKRIPQSNPRCQSLAAGGAGQCVAIPNGIRFIFGYDMVSNTAPTGSFHFGCQQNGHGTGKGEFNNLADLAASGCPAGYQVEVIGTAPQCWDGKNLDSPNHRDHVSYMVNGKCDSAHPYQMPTFTIGVLYSVQAGDDVTKWSFSSDSMLSGAKAGTTFHADFFDAWDSTARNMWTAGCINSQLNCNAGDLGDGYRLLNADKPAYGWHIPRVPVPVHGTSIAAPTGPVSTVLDEGDSISVYWLGSHTGMYASAHPNVAFFGHAVSGSQIGDLVNRQAGDLAVHPKVLTVLIGANDIYKTNGTTRTVQTWLDSLFAYVAPFRAAGIKVAVGTILPQCENGTPEAGVAGAVNANRALANVAIRAAVGTKIDAVIDYAADPVIGPDQAACNPKLFETGLHPTAGPSGGQGIMEKIYATVVDGLLK